jgi:ribokinase
VNVAVVGSYGVGLTMYVERVPDAGETLRAYSFSEGPGGKGSNQAIAARRLGADVALCSIVGADGYGLAARALWDGEGVDAAGVVSGTRPTMVGFIFVEAGGENRIVIAPGALEELAPSHIRAFTASIAAADVLVTGLEIPTAAAVEALRIGRGAGVPTILNPAPAAPLRDEDLALADHITPNRSEAAALTGLPLEAAADDLLDALRARAPRCAIVVTLGEDGVLVDGGGRRTAIPAVRFGETVDTAGAGDAFTAGYAVAIADGAEPAEAARFGVRCGGFAVTRAEVVPSLPRHEDIAPPMEASRR